jgi:hypothetical protein
MQPRLLRDGSHGVFLQGEYYLVVSQLPLDVQETGVSEDVGGWLAAGAGCVRVDEWQDEEDWRVG